MALTKLRDIRRERELENIMGNFRVEDKRDDISNLLKRAGYKQDEQNEIYRLETWTNANNLFFLSSPLNFSCGGVNIHRYVYSFKCKEERDNLVEPLNKYLCSPKTEQILRSGILQTLEGLREEDYLEVIKGVAKNITIFGSLYLTSIRPDLGPIPFFSTLLFEGVPFFLDWSEKRSLARLEESYSSLREGAKNLRLGNDALNDLLIRVGKEENFLIQP